MGEQAGAWAAACAWLAGVGGPDVVILLLWFKQLDACMVSEYLVCTVFVAGRAV